MDYKQIEQEVKQVREQLERIENKLKDKPKEILLTDGYYTEVQLKDILNSQF